MNQATIWMCYCLIGLFLTFYYFRTFNRSLAEIKKEALANPELKEEIDASYYEELEELKQKFGQYPFVFLLLIGMLFWLPILFYMMWKKKNKE